MREEQLKQIVDKMSSDFVDQSNSLKNQVCSLKADKQIIEKENKDLASRNRR